MTKKYRQYNDTQAINDWGQLFSDQNYSATLTINTDTTLTVPGGGIMGAATSYNVSPTVNGNNKMRAIIRCTSAKDVWFCINGTAAVPAGASFAAVTSELMNGQYIIARDVIVGDVLHFFCAAAGASVSVSFYALMA